MAAGVQAWAVTAWVVCLAGHAHAQLGVRGVGGGTGRVGDTPSTTITTITTTTTTDQMMPGGREAGNEGEREDPEVLADPWRWRPLEETYQGCFNEERFYGTLIFVNLTEVMEAHQVDSMERACFDMCLTKEPFSTYIAVSPAVSGGGDGCGCKDFLDFSSQVDDSGCDEVLGHYRAYCGPSNWECLNRAGQTTMASTFLILPLLTFLFSDAFLDGA